MDKPPRPATRETARPARPTVTDYARHFVRVFNIVSAAKWHPVIKQGSGVCLTEGGLVLTAAHVVEGAESLVAATAEPTADGRRLENLAAARADVMFLDAAADLAVLRLRSPLRGLQPVPSVERGRLRRGTAVIRLGSEDAGDQVSTGHVLNRLRVDDRDYIAAALVAQQGSSGGPVFRRNRLVLVGIVLMAARVPVEASPRILFLPMGAVMKILNQDPFLRVSLAHL